VKHLFIQYKTGIPTELKALGFDEPCFSYFEPYLKDEDSDFKKIL